MCVLSDVLKSVSLHPHTSRIHPLQLDLKYYDNRVNYWHHLGGWKLQTVDIGRNGPLISDVVLYHVVDPPVTQLVSKTSSSLFRCHYRNLWLVYPGMTCTVICTLQVEEREGRTPRWSTCHRSLWHSVVVILPVSEHCYYRKGSHHGHHLLGVFWCKSGDIKLSYSCSEIWLIKSGKQLLT